MCTKEDFKILSYKKIPTTLSINQYTLIPPIVIAIEFFIFWKTLLLKKMKTIKKGIGIIASWAISIPKLKNKSERANSLLFIPISERAPEKPNPCKSPKPKA